MKLHLDLLEFGWSAILDVPTQTPRPLSLLHFPASAFKPRHYHLFSIHTNLSLSDVIIYVFILLH